MNRHNIDDSFPQLLQVKEYDHNYVANGNIGGVRPASVFTADYVGEDHR